MDRLSIPEVEKAIAVPGSKETAPVLDADLTMKLESAKRLGDQLMVSRALERRFPGVFDKGPVTMKLYSEGVEGRPMVKFMLVDGTEHSLPLVELPPSVTRGFADAVDAMATRNLAHSDWRQALRLIKES
jgi:hypothetical protein